MRIKVSFIDGCLHLGLLDGEIGEFLESSIWKVRLSYAKRKVLRVEGNSLVFPEDLELSACRTIVDSLARAERWGVEMVLDSSYATSLGADSALLDGRARMGLEIKSQDAVWEDEYQSFVRSVRSQMIRTLRDRQARDAFFMYKMGRAANFSVPGSGKTSSVLGTFAYLRLQGLANRVVVLSPINAFDSWRGEWRECFGDLIPCRPLCFHDRSWSGVSRDARNRELSLRYNNYNLILLNYESASVGNGLFHAVEDRSLLVFDEIHKIKRINGARALSALELAAHSKYTIALTGTPIPNSYLDLYNLLHILYPRDYDWYFGFKLNSLANPDQAEIDRINSAICPFFCRTNKRMLGVPEPLPDHIVSVPATEEESALLQELRHGLSSCPLGLIIRVLQLESDAEMLEEEVTSLDIASFADSDDGGRSALGVEESSLSAGVVRVRLGSHIPSSKTNACLDLVDSLLRQHKKVIVWCIFTRSIRNLVGELSDRGHSVRMIDGSVHPDERGEILEAFKAGEFEVLVTNPHTLAESVSLHTVCHDAVYFECSYNLVHLLQSKDRIHRLGLPPDQYTQYHFIQTIFPCGEGGSWSLDQNIYERLGEKEQSMLDAIDSGVLERGSTDEQDYEIVLRGILD